MFTWFKKEPRGFDAHAAVVLVAAVVCAILVWLACQRLGRGLMPSLVYSWSRNLLSNPLGVCWVLLLVVSGEELIFRAAPVALAVRYLGNDSGIILVTIVGSAVFGASHIAFDGMTQYVLGLAGFLLALLYLKCAGWRNEKPWKGLLFSIGVHYCFDLAFLYFASRTTRLFTSW
jgi:membrane protease YdiL (CAAX protease family)